VQGTPGVRFGEPGVPTAVADLSSTKPALPRRIDARLTTPNAWRKYQGSAGFP